MVKKFSFSKRPTGTKKITIEIEDYEPVDVEVKVPSRSSRLGVAGSIGMSESLDEKGDSMLKYIADHVTDWSLEKPCTVESLEEIDQSELIGKLFSKLNELADSRGN